MQKIIFITILSLLLSSCFRELQVDKPILGEEQLIKVLSDIHLAESMIAEHNTKPVQFRDSLSAAYYQRIFKIHEVDAEEFEQSMEAYMGNPEEMARLYEKVLEQLQKEESKYPKKKR